MSRKRRKMPTRAFNDSMKSSVATARQDESNPGLVPLGPTKKTESANMAAFDTQVKVVHPGNPDSCWLWTGKYRGGGVFRPPINVKHDTSAIRWVFENNIGSLPERTTVLYPKLTCQLSNEHLGNSKKMQRGRCVNPAHYVAMTPLQAYRLDFGDEAKTECPNGHPYTDDSTTYSLISYYIFCRVCEREKKRQQRHGTNGSAPPEVPDSVEPVITSGTTEDEVTWEAKTDEPAVEPVVEPETPAEVKPSPSTSNGFSASDTFSYLAGTGIPPAVRLGQKLKANEKQVNAFLEKIEQLDNNCWKWTGMGVKPESEGKAPVPKFSTLGVTYQPARRWVYEVTYGTVPQGTMLIQDEKICTEVLCVNPAHRKAMSRGQYNAFRTLGTEPEVYLKKHVVLTPEEAGLTKDDKPVTVEERETHSEVRLDEIRARLYKRVGPDLDNKKFAVLVEQAKAMTRSEFEEFLVQVDEAAASPASPIPVSTVPPYPLIRPIPDGPYREITKPVQVAEPKPSKPLPPVPATPQIPVNGKADVLEKLKGVLKGENISDVTLDYLAEQCLGLTEEEQEGMVAIFLRGVDEGDDRKVDALSGIPIRLSVDFMVDSNDAAALLAEISASIRRFGASITKNT